jgi:hypothetical protein
VSKLDQHELDKAIAQFIGYTAGVGGDSVIGLVESMGLTKAEYIAIRDEVAVPKCMNWDYRAELDEHFGISKVATVLTQRSEAQANLTKLILNS